MAPDSVSNNKRIARNTMMLYIRMLLLMVISLYTSRVVLSQLGVTDFGVYNVVGGVISMLSFFNYSMATATRRFMSYAIGRKDRQLEESTFSMALVTHLGLAVGIALLAETVGLWFVYNYIVIPAESFDAAIFVYHVSVLTAVVGILVVPFIALVTSHENMKIYAYISILEAVIKLGIAFALVAVPGGKLRAYSLLMLSATLVIDGVWVAYCRRTFSYCRFRFKWNKSLWKELTGFVGWQTYAAGAMVMRTQGVNIVLNLFFGPLLNAARGVAVQVNAAAVSFVNNFTMAADPQVTKNYAVGDYAAMELLLRRSSKFCFLLVFVIATPLIMETPAILGLWLEEVPEYAVSFVRLILLTLLCENLSGILGYGALATGKIRNYQLTIGTMNILVIVLVYIGFRLGFSPHWMFIAEMIICLVNFLVRLNLLNRIIGLSRRRFIGEVTLRCLAAAAVTALICAVVQQFMPDTVAAEIGGVFISVTVSALASMFIALSAQERSWIITFAIKFIGKFKHKV